MGYDKAWAEPGVVTPIKADAFANLTPGDDHSPVGASAAERFTECTGSVVVAAGCVDDDDEFSAPGSAAHKLGERCLIDGKEPWHYMGWYYIKDCDMLVKNMSDEDASEMEAIVIDKEIGDAVFEYIDAVRRTHHFNKLPGNYAWVEKQFHCPSLHYYFWGMSDFVYWDEETKTLHIWDYKHGAGIVVDVQWNKQLMYYGAGIVHELNLENEVETVVLHVAQPRGFHFDGPIRSWGIDYDDLDQWLFDVMLPAMQNCLDEDPENPNTTPGEHCRFCPARGYACPGILESLDRMEVLMNEMNGADELSEQDLGEFLGLFEVAKIAQKKHRDTAYHRAMAGKVVPGQKLVNGRANRDWHEGGEDALVDKYGDKAYAERKIKSPAQIEKLPQGKAMATKHSSKPPAGLTLVPITDSRREVSRDTKALFKGVAKKGKAK